MNGHQDQYRSLDATELYCPRCRRATPVRQHLLLMLPTGNQYEYRCRVCGTSVGSKTDDDAREFHAVLTSGLEGPHDR
jgi:hypothetical protein